jgi:hypothetical protein
MRLFMIVCEPIVAIFRASGSGWELRASRFLRTSLFPLDAARCRSMSLDSDAGRAHKLDTFLEYADIQKGIFAASVFLQCLVRVSAEPLANP